MAKAGTAEFFSDMLVLMDIPQLKELVNTKSSTTDRELREIMSLAATAHIAELLEFKDFAELDVMSVQSPHVWSMWQLRLSIAEPDRGYHVRTRHKFSGPRRQSPIKLSLVDKRLVGQVDC